MPTEDIRAARSDSEDCIRHPQHQVGEAYLGRPVERRRSGDPCPRLVWYGACRKRELLEGAMSEVLAVAGARGAALSDGYSETGARLIRPGPVDGYRQST